MKYYESHEDAYRRIKKENIASWDEFRKESESFDTYDIIIDGHCMHCITYDSDRRAALTNVFRLLKNGGYFIIETMSIEDTSQWPYEGRIDEQGIVWNRVKKNYPYDKVRFEGKYWICTRRIMSNSDLEDELKQAGFVIEFSEITTEIENEYMTDYRAICRKVVTN